MYEIFAVHAPVETVHLYLISPGHRAFRLLWHDGNQFVFAAFGETMEWFMSN
jgi:hypothetical protein